MTIALPLNLADKVGINHVFVLAEGVSLEQAQHMRDLRDKLGLDKLDGTTLGTARASLAEYPYEVERARVEWLETFLMNAFAHQKVQGVFSDFVLSALEKVQLALRPPKPAPALPSLAEPSGS